MRQLVLDRVPPDFHPDTHVALGPWCFHRAEHIFPEWETLWFPRPFGSPEERHAAGEAVRLLSNELLDRLWPEMNARHGKCYARAYWHSLLMNWLIHLTMLSWQLWRHVEIFVQRFQTEPFTVAIRSAARPFSFGSTHDFIMACFHPSDFRVWLVHEIARRQSVVNWQISAGIGFDPGFNKAPAVKRRDRRPVEHINGIGFIWRMLLGIAVYIGRKHRSVRHDQARTNPTTFPDAFKIFLNELVTSTMPESVGGGFAALHAEAERHRYHAGRAYCTQLNFHDDASNFIAAHAVKNGERIFAVQHGGGYGWPAFLPLLAEMEYSHDSFVTWGWDRHDDYRGKFIPLPSPYLSHHVRHRAARVKSGELTQNIILVGAVMYSLNPRIDFYPDPIGYRKWKQRFVTTLNGDAFSALLYRPYHADEAYDDADWLCGRFPTLAKLDGDLNEALWKCRLAVLDHPTTTLAQTLAANIPTIAFWENDAWPLARDAKPAFMKLREAGVLFDNPEQAAQQINQILPCLEMWWQDPQRQRARRAWCDQYALADRSWGLRWFKALRN